MGLTAKVTTTFLRGERIYAKGKIVCKAAGKYLQRPC
jgi:hypothetical protein